LAPKNQIERASQSCSGSNRIGPANASRIAASNNQRSQPIASSSPSSSRRAATAQATEPAAITKAPMATQCNVGRNMARAWSISSPAASASASFCAR
jgi:hypothetical protein